MEIDTIPLISHNTRMRKPLDLTGRVFGYLTVLRSTNERLENSIAWECRCVCGNVRLIAAKLLTGKKRISCGCRRSSARPRFEATCQECGASYEKSAWGVSSPLCIPCRKKHRRVYEQSFQRKDSSKATRKARYQRNVARGMCPHCGVRPLKLNSWACEECLVRFETNRIKHRYGVTAAEFTAQMERQNGRCAICRNELISPYVDHKHDDGRTFRGLLCRDCNGGIGLLKDNPLILQRAAEYIRWNGFKEVDSHDLMCAAA